MLDKNFTSDRYFALLKKLRKNDYLSRRDLEILMKDCVKHNSIILTNINEEKAEIVRKAILEISRARLQ